MSRSEPNESHVTRDNLRLYVHDDASRTVRKQWFYNISKEHQAIAPTDSRSVYMHWVKWNADMASKYNATYNNWDDYYEFTDERDMILFLLRWS